jgi:hypothetical protein
MRRHLLNRITDYIGQYTRLTCPHCPLTIRYRGVTTTEEKQLRAHMADHITSHRA